MWELGKFRECPLTDVGESVLEKMFLKNREKSPKNQRFL